MSFRRASDVLAGFLAVLGGWIGACSAGDNGQAAAGSPCVRCPPSGACLGGACGDAGGESVEGLVVPALYFGVIGDTRPEYQDDTANYPTRTISAIYQDLAGMDPQPQFIVTTGDYQFADPWGGEGAAQIGLYLSAAAFWTGGPIFSAMGNHECTGYTDSNCPPGSPTNNYLAWFNAFIAPLGQSVPYYVVPLQAADRSWTAKVVVVACNAWDGDQEAWLQAQLAAPTTYTFVVRHEPPGTSAPCVAPMDAMLAGSAYDLLIVGHDHEFADRSSEGYVVVGNGGAPISGRYGYGYVTIQQVDRGFTVTDYDAETASPTASFGVR